MNPLTMRRVIALSADNLRVKRGDPFGGSSATMPSLSKAPITLPPRWILRPTRKWQLSARPARRWDGLTCQVARTISVANLAHAPQRHLLGAAGAHLFRQHPAGYGRDRIRRRLPVCRIGPSRRCTRVAGPAPLAPKRRAAYLTPGYASLTSYRAERLFGGRPETAVARFVP